uniref:Putative secreted protein n=1 Tax=Anopheles marajoara TaxID=58244 RepID=A0A2M4CCB8_9DIPT
MTGHHTGAALVVAALPDADAGDDDDDVRPIDPSAPAPPPPYFLRLTTTMTRTNRRERPLKSQSLPDDDGVAMENFLVPL